MVLLLTNTLCTLCLRGRRFHTMSFYNCNILQGASIKELFRFSQLQVRLLRKVHLYKCVVGMRGRNGGISSATWWHIRTALRFAWWGQWQEGSLYGALSVVIFMEFGQVGAKRYGGHLKVISWGWGCKGALLMGKAGSHFVILLYFETLLQVLPGIYCKTFYWIPLFTILLLFYVFEVGKAKSSIQSVLMILH